MWYLASTVSTMNEGKTHWRKFSILSRCNMKCRAMSRQLVQVQNGATDTTFMDVHHESDSLKNKDKRSEGKNNSSDETIFFKLKEFTCNKIRIKFESRIFFFSKTGGQHCIDMSGSLLKLEPFWMLILKRFINLLFSAGSDDIPAEIKCQKNNYLNHPQIEAVT